MNSIAEIATVLKNTKSAVIFTHMRPDGDTIGSGMALSRALSFLKVANEVVNEGEIPEKFSFLPAVKEIKRSPSLDAACYITVDCSEEARLGALEGAFRMGARKKTTVNLDHHISNTNYARYNFVRQRASNCENIAELIRALRVPIAGEVADFLMLGMVTDSGGFSHGDVNGDSFRAAALAADGGADVGKIAYETMKRQSKARAGMYAEVISHLRYFLGDALAVAAIPESLLAKYSLGQDASEGIVDFALSIDGVEVSVCLLESKRGQYKASFRSKGRVDVNAVAKSFGGGGHTFASGCMLFGELEEVFEKIRYAVWQNSEL